MSFSSWQDFWAMGGYAFYVWLSYGLSLLLLIAVMLAPLARQRQLKRMLVRDQRRATALKNNDQGIVD